MTDVHALVHECLGPVLPDADGAGIVAGVVLPDRTEFVTLGAGDPDKLYEIGSITKAFTGILLAQMAEAGEVKPDDPLDRYGIDLPVTLEQLATHTSGLPRLPPNMPVANPLDPYADYTADLLNEALGTIELESEPGAKVAYSNLGFGLLGHILGLVAGTPYHDLVEQRVCAPLGLHETTAHPERFEDRLQTGIGPQGTPTPHWTFDALAAAGCLHSTVAGMVAFLRANLDPPSRALEEAMRPRVSSNEHMRVGLGWHVLRDVTWHNGGTFGFHSFAGLRREAGVAAVALRNTSPNPSLDMPMIGLIGRLA